MKIWKCLTRITGRNMTMWHSMTIAVLCCPKTFKNYLGWVFKIMNKLIKFFRIFLPRRRQPLSQIQTGFVNQILTNTTNGFVCIAREWWEQQPNWTWTKMNWEIQKEQLFLRTFLRWLETFQMPRQPLNCWGYTFKKIIKKYY